MSIPSWIQHIRTPTVSKKGYLPVYAPVLDGNEKKYLLQCIQEGWISPKGPFVPRFEAAFAEYCGVRFALACSSGTAALQLALAVLDTNKDTEVVIPTFTMVSTALAASYIGAKIRFADCDVDTGNVSVEEFEKTVTQKTKVIMPVDVYGCPSDIVDIMEWAKAKSIHVVEDAAEAFGASIGNRRVGSLCTLSAFSLYVNKVVTTGQGGMITTDDKKLYEKLKRLNNYYFSPVRHFWHEKIGYNFKMSNLEAAVGVAQLERIEKTLKEKGRVAETYKHFLHPIGEYFFPLGIPAGKKSNHWQIAYRLRTEKHDLMKLRQVLGKNGIETRGFFIPLHLQPPFYRAEYINKFPTAERLARTGFLLPSGPSLTTDDIERVCGLIVRYFRGTK
jgi:perosamine synthetase